MPPMSDALMWGMPYAVRRISAEKPVAPGVESVSLSALFAAVFCGAAQDERRIAAMMAAEQATPAESLIAISPELVAGPRRFTASYSLACPKRPENGQRPASPLGECRFGHCPPAAKGY